MAKTLVVDEEQSILESPEMFLVEKGYIVYKAHSAEKGLSLLH